MRDRPLSSRVLIFSALGIGIGAVFAVWGAIAFALGGDTAAQQEGVSLGSLAVFYLISGALAGALVGALLPLTRSRPGAVLVGTFAAAPVYLLGFAAMYGLAEWTSGNLVFLVIWSVIVGGGVALMNR